MARLRVFGISEIVVKNRSNSALVAAGTMREFVPVPEVVVPVDTTAAGDGFNAGYLAARLNGIEVAQAASAAHRLAGDVIRHTGALVNGLHAAHSKDNGSGFLSRLLPTLPAPQFSLTKRV